MISVILKFLICTAVIFYFGKRVARYGDAIAEKTGLGGLWIGVILVSIATSLPELFTGVGSTLFVDAPDLSVGNLFGANSYNLVNIATLDLLHKGGPLLSSVSSGQLLTAVFSLIPLSIAAMGIFLTPKLPNTDILNISLYSMLILASYAVCTRAIYNFEKKRKIIGELREEEEEVLKYEDISLKTASMRYAIAALAIAAAGIWLAYIGDDLSVVFGLGKNFVGSLFLGFATTLPEITVSIAAIRLGAKELAVANMVGSNLFNITIIFINDILYRKAPIFSVLSQQHIFTAFIVVLMTAVLMAGIILKPKNKTKLGLSNYAIWLIVVFVIGAYINFMLGGK
ncbi:MAG: hypothetical protein KBB52_02320 [Candidatus Omnitrophica bacterium]|nr:hypothetical protein [Candidatus Omnitrophota bacterium]